jgi:hypothetical protein
MCVTTQGLVLDQTGVDEPRRRLVILVSPTVMKRLVVSPIESAMSGCGKGVVANGSGILSQRQYFGTGDRKGKGTNFYELIAKLSKHGCRIGPDCRYRLVATGPARSTVKSHRVSTFLPFTFAVRITVYIFGSNF